MFQTSADFQYIDLWSSKFTWGGNEKDMPVDGDLVVIQQHMTVLLDTNTPKMKMLLIQGQSVWTMLFEIIEEVH